MGFVLLGNSLHKRRTEINIIMHAFQHTILYILHTENNWLTETEWKPNIQYMETFTCNYMPIIAYTLALPLSNHIKCIF